MVKSRQTAPASSDLMCASVNAMRTVTSQATFKASVFVVHPALRSVILGLFLLALLKVAVMTLGKFQLWMTGAGLLMVAMSVATAVQEFKLPKTVSSYQGFLKQEMNKCGIDMDMLPHLSPIKGNATEKQQQITKDAVSSTTLNIASVPTPSTSDFPSKLQEKSRRRGSEDSIGELESAINTTRVETAIPCNNNTEVSKKLDVLHCGTVIDIQGSHGFIIPHDLRMEAEVLCKIVQSSTAAGSNRRKKQQKMPLVIPFNLNEEQAAARQEIAVGKTVEFAYSPATASSDSPATVCALNVTPVPTDDVIVKSRSALQSCKQAREVSFARAMEELTMISPRNVPVEHHVDLIKYAEKLDDYDTPFDQHI